MFVEVSDRMPYKLACYFWTGDMKLCLPITVVVTRVRNSRLSDSSVGKVTNCTE
jgi:hypothetical protein